MNKKVSKLLGNYAYHVKHVQDVKKTKKSLKKFWKSLNHIEKRQFRKEIEEKINSKDD